MLPNYSVTAKGNTENVASRLFILCSHNLKTTLKGWSFQATYFIQEINSIVQKGLGLTPFVAMMETLGLDSSIGGSLCKEAMNTILQCKVLSSGSQPWLYIRIIWKSFFFLISKLGSPTS